MGSRITKGIRVKDGKVERVYRLSVSKRIGAKNKAERLEKTWKGKSK